MHRIAKIIQQNQLANLFQQGSFGIEKESLRVHSNGELALSSHPEVFGDRNFQPYIQTDFGESQLELITPPTNKVSDTLRWLSAIHQVVQRNLAEDEYIFPLSMPPKLPDDSQIKVAQLDNSDDVAYREHLVQRYGKKKQMVSGIHYNFQISPNLVAKLHKLISPEQDLVEFQNNLYLKMVRNFLRYQWILVYLFSASPMVDASYFHQGSPIKVGQYVRSLRSSAYGYVNDPEVQVSFADLNSYVESLEHWVQIGKLTAEKEFYSNARLRGANRARDLLTTGIKYVEFRLFDLNPFAEFGMTAETANFIHYFILLMVWIDEQCSAECVNLGKERLFEVALEDPFTISKYQDEGLKILDLMAEMLQAINAPSEIWEIFSHQQEAMVNPQLTLCARTVSAIEKAGSYENFGAQLAKTYKANALERPYCLDSFANLELSTQALLTDAILQGVKVEFLDENDNFLKLSFQEHVEYVKNGNMTSLDSYIAPLIMENKVVTKKILAQAVFNVPQSLEFQDLITAQQHFAQFLQRPIVIKPKSTNYGLGISIFPQGVAKIEDFSTAIKLALQEDATVMVEDYLAGTEYRFLVLNDQCEAVLLRVPANVVGDGVSTIAQLVTHKNNSPLRGDGKHSPLKKIELGELELLHLKNQNLTPNSIPSAGTVVQLRANSNISTGGDSIDMTDQMHQSYKEIAVGVAQVLGAKVCGVDLIIPDFRQPANSKQAWGIIEANFNPMMMMHIYPAQGKSRRVTAKVLAMLFPELPYKFHWV